MPYVTRIERLAEARGERLMVVRLLNRKFGEISEPMIEQINELSVAQVEALGEALLDWKNPADLEQWLIENARLENS